MKISPRLRRWLLIAAGVVLAYAILGFFVAPPLVRTQLEKRATAALHRPVQVAAVRINPFVMSITISDLAVTDHDGAELASWQRVYVNFDPLTSLFRREWHLGDVRLTQPHERLLIAADGTLNIADLLAPETSAGPAPATTPTAAPLPALGIGELHVDGWEVDFTDRSRRTPFHTRAGPLTFELHNFSTRPDGSGPYSFAGSSDSFARLAWTGTVSAAPVGSKGHIEIDRIALPPLMPFLEEQFGGTVRQGTVSLALDYDVSAGATTAARITACTVSIDDLGVSQRNASATVIGWKQLEIRLAKADLVARTADVTRIALTGLDAKAERRADGTIDLLDLMPTPTSETGAASPAADTGPAPSVSIGELALIDSRVQVDDHATPRPGAITLDQINVTARNAGTDLDREIKLDARAQWEGGGTLSAGGVVRLLPFAASIDLEGTAVALHPLENWIEPVVDIRIAGGTVHFHGHVDAAQPRGEKLTLTWTGDNGIDALDVRDGKSGDPLLAWGSLTNKDVRFNLDPLEFSADEIALVAPVAHVAIDKEGNLNLAYVVAPSAVAEAAPPAAQPSATGVTAPKASAVVAAATHQSLPFSAKVGAVTVAQGNVLVSDRSVPGGFTTQLRELTGSVRGLSSEEVARAEVDFSASLDGVAPLHIKGSINPLAKDRFSDVHVAFSNIDLPLFTPYAGKFLGQKIQKGKLNVDLTYRLSQNVLEAENNATLDQFYLGEKVESPDAIKLPIGLALAVLRERDGTIPIHMPIRGSLDDPDFKYGQLVLQFLGNLFVKAATAPFKMLGGLFGGGKELDLSYVDFASGTTDFSETAADKLGVLQKALHERPALRLEISAPPSPDGDRAGLREQRLQALLRAARTEPADTPIAPDEADALVRAVFAQKFPEEAVAAQAPAAATPTEAPSAPDVGKKPGFLQRLSHSIFGGGEEAPTKPAAPEAETAPPAEPVPTLTVAEMRARLLDTITLTDADFQDVATARARAIRDRLVTDGTVEAERVFLVTAPTVPEGANNATEGGRVFFGLE